MGSAISVQVNSYETSLLDPLVTKDLNRMLLSTSFTAPHATEREPRVDQSSVFTEATLVYGFTCAGVGGFFAGLVPPEQQVAVALREEGEACVEGVNTRIPQQCPNKFVKRQAPSR